MSDPHVSQMVEESIFADLRDALLTELKEAPEVWQKMSQKAQDEIIERIDKRVLACVEEATALMTSHHFPVVEGVIDGITIKGDTKVSVKVPQMTPSMHDLIDEGQGSTVRLVLADPRAFTGMDGSVTSDKDQPDLPLDEQVRVFETVDTKELAKAMKVADEFKPVAGKDETGEEVLHTVAVNREVEAPARRALATAGLTPSEPKPEPVPEQPAEE